jgi:para-aminobenzoate synthetase component 1
LNTKNFAVTEFGQTKEQVLNWLTRFSIFCFLDNHNYQIPPHSVECLVAAGVKKSMQCSAGNALDQLQRFVQNKDGWLFGHLGYDLKNEIESLSSNNQDNINFPDLFFFEPQIVIRLGEKEMSIEAGNPEEVWDEIKDSKPRYSATPEKINIKTRISKQEYCEIITRLKQHILRGDCYEINFCRESYAENAVIDPTEVYKKLSALSPNPFSALYRLNNQWLLCASPERYLKKKGNQILTQPIKGTAKRNRQQAEEDERQKLDLYKSPKDRSENVMVVDLVRNDLAKICRKGTVNADELYGIYSFPQVHQMISTVSGRLKNNISFAGIIKATFPMGSMTGAPKKKVMELIERYEKTKRGLFSGALGYINPQSDFDFNVVIRSILYNAEKKFLSFQTGSGITFYSDAEKEWDECEIKAEAMQNVLRL